MGRSVLACLLTLVVMAGSVVGCGATATPSPKPTPTPTATPLPTPSPTPEITPSPSPTVDPNLTPTPMPTGGPGAFAVVKAYEDDLLAGDFARAWARIGKTSQAHWGSFSGFQTDRTKFLATSGTAFQEELDPTNTLTIPQWLEGHNFPVDLTKAHLVSIHWTSLADPNAGWEIWILSPVKTGWAMFLVR